MPSVAAAAMNTIDARSSFSPFTLLKRPLEIIQINRGMLRMRISVMELGRFTTRRTELIILHGCGERNARSAYFDIKVKGLTTEGTEAHREILYSPCALCG